jgi:hypothetical protein
MISFFISVKGNNYFFCDTMTDFQYCGLARNIAYHLPKTMLTAHGGIRKTKEDLYREGAAEYKNWKGKL